MWSVVYANGGKTLYCGVKFSTKNRQERKKYVNAEHVYPMAWVVKALRCGTRRQCQKSSQRFRTIAADLHNIYPALIVVNRARSHYRFGEVLGEKRRFGRCDFEVNRRAQVAEPAPKKRGMVARSILYLAYRYKLPLSYQIKKRMQKWDSENPPSKAEKRREKIIDQQQGKTNPFISRYPFRG